MSTHAVMNTGSEKLGPCANQAGYFLRPRVAPEEIGWFVKDQSPALREVFHLMINLHSIGPLVQCQADDFGK
jgi:hypothetical protein